MSGAVVAFWVGVAEVLAAYYLGRWAQRRAIRTATRNAAVLLHRIADRVGDRFDYVIADAGPFREAAEALDRISGPANGDER